MKRNYLAHAIFASTAILCLISNVLVSKVLIWDLGYTLIEPNHFYIARQIGMRDCLCMYVRFGSMAFNALNESVYDVLMNGEEEYLACVPNDPEGRLMPNCMCDWIKSTKTNKEVLDHALQKANTYPDYINDRHKRLTKSIIKWMLCPEKFGRSMRPMYKAPALLRDCARVKDKNGKPAHTFYILSNWDEESFEYLYKEPENRKIFKYFKPGNIFISGQCREMKPHILIYKQMIEKYNLDPADCVVIDDQGDNVRAARKVGMTAIQLRNGNYRELRKKLKAEGIL